MSETDGFTSAGRERFPSIYSDLQQIGDYATWPREALDSRISEYQEFLKRDDLMPRAIEGAQRLLTHLGFEVCYRDGLLDAPEN